MSRYLTPEPAHAALRAAVEGVGLGTYFGSWMALDFHVADAKEVGWLNEDGSPTDAGRAEYARLRLDQQPRCRWYLWRIPNG